MVEGIRNVQRAHGRGCPDLADSPGCFSLAAQRQTLGGRGAAGSLAPSSLRQQRVRLPPTRSSSARPRRPPEERLGAAAGLGVAHPARAPRLSRSGGHSAGHTGRLWASARTCRVPPSRRFGVSGPAGLAERDRARAPAPPLRLAPPPGQSPRARRPARALRPAAAPAATAAERFTAAPGFQLRAGTGSVGGGAGGGQETEKRGRVGAGSREPEPQPGPELGRLLRRRLPPPSPHRRLAPPPPQARLAWSADFGCPG